MKRKRAKSFLKTSGVHFTPLELHLNLSYILATFLPMGIISGIGEITDGFYGIRSASPMLPVVPVPPSPLFPFLWQVPLLLRIFQVAARYRTT